MQISRIEQEFRRVEASQVDAKSDLSQPKGKKGARQQGDRRAVRRNRRPSIRITPVARDSARASTAVNGNEREGCFRDFFTRVTITATPPCFDIKLH